MAIAIVLKKAIGNSNSVFNTIGQLWTIRLSTFIPSALKFLLLLYFLVDGFLKNSVVCSNKAAAANICAHDQRSCKSFRLGVNLVLMP